MEWQSNVSRKLQEDGRKGFGYFLSKWPKKSITMRGLANVQTDEIQSACSKAVLMHRNVIKRTS